MKKHSEIILDGNTTDWLGKPPQSYNKGTISMREYIWNDSVYDDVGATKAAGGYTYPTGVPAGSLDIIEFRVCIDNSSLNFLIKFRELVNAGGILNFSHQFVEILIDINRNGSGRNDTLRNANLALDSQCGWEYAIWLDGFGNCSMLDLNGIQSPVYALGNEVENCIEVKINISYFSVLPDLQTWQYIVLSGARAESLPDPQYGSRACFAEVNDVATSTTGGGGLSAGSDPNVYDMVFTTTQANLLNTYSTTPTPMVAQGAYDNGIILDGSTIEAQSFIATSTAVINTVEVYLKRDPGTPRRVYLSIQENDDLNTENQDDDIPSGIRISSREINNANPSPNNYISVLFTFADPPLVCAGRKYWIVVETEPVAPKNAYLAYWSNPLGNIDRYVNGMRVTKTIATGSWTHHTAQDILFFISILAPSVSNASANLLFAPIYFTKISSFGIGANEYVTILYDGLGSATADLTNWSISNFDYSLSFGAFALQNGSWCVIHVGPGANTSSELYFSRSEMFNDSADEVILLTPSCTIIDFVSYSDACTMPLSPPFGTYWSPESSEPLPSAPKLGEYLKLLGLDNDYYSDWAIDLIPVADHLYVSADEYATAGENFTVLIEAKDYLNNTIIGYFGVVQIHAVMEDGFTNTTHNLSLDSVLITNGQCIFSVNYPTTETIRIFARSGSAVGVSENVTIIAGSLAKISISPSTLNISAGESAQFTAYGFDAYDNPVELSSVAWTTDVGTIFSSGYFTASTFAPISGFVYASVGMLTCASVVNVSPNIFNHIHIIPNITTIVVNGSMQFSAVVHDIYNNVIDTKNESFNWSSLRGSVNSTGYYIAPTIAGLDDVIVDFAGIFATCIINVTPGDLAKIEISPQVDNLTAGSIVQFSASAFDMYGNLIENVEFEWSTSIGSISNDGLLSVTNQSNVTGYVRVSNGTILAEITVTVKEGGLARIVVYPNSWNMTTDEEKQFFAVGYDVVGNVVPAEFVWDCEGGTIDNTGLFKPDRVGQAVVRAHFWPFFGVANVNVSIGKIVSIVISPIGAEITADETIQFQATGYDADLNTGPLNVNLSECCGVIIYQNGTYEAI
ncbi:MAG: glucodextranase DOMON-like domain-containing protein [Thermoplasmata archaeon]